MPELPEVEVTRLGLTHALSGARITALRLGKPLRWPLGCTAQKLVGQRITRLDRRGKYLLLKLIEGELIVHLGMSGSLRWVAGDQGSEAPGEHEHFILQTDRGQLRMRDPRRFGAVVWHPPDNPAHALLAKLGPEPLDPTFDGARLRSALHARRAAIKPLLLDQAIVAGIGNIYACEALFRAAIHPETPAGSLSLLSCTRLAAEIRHTLGDAVAAGGSSLRDFAHTDGELGYFQLNTRVYGRAGQACKVCATPIAQITQSQRSTYFCPKCQRRRTARTT